MSQRTLPLKTLLLGCALLAMPLSAAEPPQNLREKVQVSPPLRLDPDDPLHLWFKEQDKVLDEILVRLARIEQLVRDLHRLIMSLPDPAPGRSGIPAAPPPPLQTAATPAPTSDATAQESGGMTLPLAAGLALLLGLLGYGYQRRRRPTSAKPEPAKPPLSTPPAVPPRPVQPPIEPGQPSESVVTAPPIALDQNDQALELAEIMLSMGLGHGAAQTLIEQIRREPRQGLLHWLKLLEIYRKNGQQAEFEHSAEELRQHFNIQPEAWHAQAGKKRSIENYPHIATRLAEVWGTPASLTYLQNLLGDNRGGARAGFPQPVVEECVLLVGILKEMGISA